MNLSELRAVLLSAPEALVRFRLPDGTRSALHAHITEVGLITKSFVDCGGTVRRTSYCLLQSWVADDFEHRLRAGKLLSIIDKAGPLLGQGDLPVELEHQLEYATQFRLSSADVTQDEVTVTLSGKETACLAPEKCCPPQTEQVMVSLSRRK